MDNQNGSIPESEKESATRPTVYDWGIVGENTALRRINTHDPIDMERYWQTNQSPAPGLMVDDIENMEELADNAKLNGRRLGFTFAISGTVGEETGEFQGFVQFTSDRDDLLRRKIAATGLFEFFKEVVLWEVSYAKYPPSAPHQVASAVRQGCVLLLRKLDLRGFYPQVAIIGCVSASENPASLRVLNSACFDPIASPSENPAGIILYEDAAQELDSVWLLNWDLLHHRLRAKAKPHWEEHFQAT